jgi:hypothetical protein
LTEVSACGVFISRPVGTGSDLVGLTASSTNRNTGSKCNVRRHHRGLTAVIAPLEVDSDCLCQFNHVNPTLAASQCHHVGRCRHLGLCEPGLLPLLNEQPPHCLVPGRSQNDYHQAKMRQNS